MTARIVTAVFVLLAAPGCGLLSEPVRLVAPASATASAVLACVEACDEDTDPAVTLARECAPRTLDAMRAWCTAGVLDGPVCGVVDAARVLAGGR